jgi:hypothetical protein
LYLYWRALSSNLGCAILYNTTEQLFG